MCGVGVGIAELSNQQPSVAYSIKIAKSEWIPKVDGLKPPPPHSLPCPPVSSLLVVACMLYNSQCAIDIQ